MPSTPIFVPASPLVHLCLSLSTWDSCYHVSFGERGTNLRTMLSKPEVDKKSSLASPTQRNRCGLCGTDTLVTAARTAMGSVPTALNTQEQTHRNLWAQL